VPLKPNCPFCLSRLVQPTSSDNGLTAFQCEQCHQHWIEVGDTRARNLAAVYSPMPVKSRPACPTCHVVSAVSLERVVTGEVRRTIWTCARCQTSWPSESGGIASA
jgi:transposase-like protein